MQRSLAYLAMIGLLALPQSGVAQTSPAASPPAASPDAAPSGAAPQAVPPPIEPQAVPPPIEPKAVAILKAACAALSGARAMSFDALNTYEKAARNGQPLFYSTLNHVTLQRPNMLRVMTPGDGVADEFYYDGKAMMAYVPSQDLVAVAPAPPTIEKMLDTAWEKAAIYFPFADMIVSHPCDVFEKDGLNSAFYVGQSKVIGGTVTDMVAVAGDNVQAELWIGAHDHLPRMIRVVYPHEPAHALYQTEYSNWHLLEKIDPATFTTPKAAKAHKMKFAPPGADQVKPGQPATASAAAPAPAPAH